MRSELGKDLLGKREGTVLLPFEVMNGQVPRVEIEALHPPVADIRKAAVRSHREQLHHEIKRRCKAPQHRRNRFTG